MKLFLNKEELEQLTGYKIRTKQIEMLQHNQVPYWVSRDGSPVVARNAFNHNEKSKNMAKIKASRPNVDGLREALK